MDKTLNIYKPKGWTSFDVIAKLRGKLGVRKIGHAGTLDPMAEGVLIVLVGEATKRQNDFMHKDKEYYAEIAFGFETDTYDLEGQVLKTYFDGLDDFDASKKLVETSLGTFKGKIVQEVPPFSAVKIQGKRLYKYARSGEVKSITLPLREIEIKNIRWEGFENKFVEKIGRQVPILAFTISCGYGTYIRSIAHDLGKKSGLGGTLIKLVRTKVGDFRVEDSTKIEDVVV